MDGGGVVENPTQPLKIMWLWGEAVHYDDGTRVATRAHLPWFSHNEQTS